MSFFDEEEQPKTKRSHKDFVPQEERIKNKDTEGN